jgi:hypothetical protein
MSTRCVHDDLPRCRASPPGGDGGGGAGKCISVSVSVPNALVAGRALVVRPACLHSATLHTRATCRCLLRARALADNDQQVEQKRLPVGLLRQKRQACWQGRRWEISSDSRAVRARRPDPTSVPCVHLLIIPLLVLVLVLASGADSTAKLVLAGADAAAERGGSVQQQAGLGHVIFVCPKDSPPCRPCVVPLSLLLPAARRRLCIGCVRAQLCALAESEGVVFMWCCGQMLHCITHSFESASCLPLEFGRGKRMLFGPGRRKGILSLQCDLAAAASSRGSACGGKASTTWRRLRRQSRCAAGVGRPQ